jgi:hypothetical protein
MSRKVHSYIELSVMPDVALISSVRIFVEGLYSPVLADSDASARVALATHELIENAIRYSSDGVTGFRIEVTGEERRKRLVIRTWNRIDEGRQRDLEEMFQEMESEPDAFEHYLHLMRRNAKRDDGRSGLGLARIRAEAEMSLGFRVEDSVVCIEAETQVELAR